MMCYSPPLILVFFANSHTTQVTKSLPSRASYRQITVIPQLPVTSDECSKWVHKLSRINTILLSFHPSQQWDMRLWNLNLTKLCRSLYSIRSYLQVVLANKIKSLLPSAAVAVDVPREAVCNNSGCRRWMPPIFQRMDERRRRNLWNWVRANSESKTLHKYARKFLLLKGPFLCSGRPCL